MLATAEREREISLRVIDRVLTDGTHILWLKSDDHFVTYNAVD